MIRAALRSIACGILLSCAAPASAQSLFSEGANLIVTRGDPLPPSLDAFAYDDTDAFDVQVYASMQDLSDFKISLATPAQSLPRRAQMWATHIRRARQDGRTGRVITCDINRDAPLFGLLTGIFRTVGNALFNRGRNYLLYRPARNFNAILEVDSTDRRIRSLRIVSRDETDRITAFYGERRCRG